MDPSENPYASPLAPPETTRQSNYFYWLQAAAMGLIIISLLEILVAGCILVILANEIFFELPKQAGGAPLYTEEPMAMAGAAVSFLRSATVFVGAICMRLRKKYRLAQAGAIISCMGVVFYPLWLGVPFGLWALMLLLRAYTRAAFAQSSHRS
jgi:hypothetical protein